MRRDRCRAGLCVVRHAEFSGRGYGVGQPALCQRRSRQFHAVRYRCGAAQLEQTTREDPIFAAYPDEDCYVVSGTDGSLAIPTMRLRFYGDRAKRSWRVPFEEETIGIERADPLTRQLANFCAVIRGTAEPVVSARDGLQNVRVLDAIRQAAASGQTCVIEK